MTYRVEFKDFNGKIFAEFRCKFIADTISVYNSISAWEKYIIDNKTGEIIVFDNGKTFDNALEIKR